LPKMLVEAQQCFFILLYGGGLVWTVPEYWFGKSFWTWINPRGANIPAGRMAPTVQLAEPLPILPQREADALHMSYKA
jgi:hypothetical protein